MAAWGNTVYLCDIPIADSSRTVKPLTTPEELEARATTCFFQVSIVVGGIVPFGSDFIALLG